MVCQSGRFGVAAGPTPTFMAAGTIAGSSNWTTGNFPVAQPAGISALDILFASISYNDPNVSSPVVTAFATPSGWSVARTQVDQLGMSGILFWKRAVGGESGNVNFTKTGGASAGNRTSNGLIVAYRGCKTTGDPFEASASNSGNGTTMTGSSVITTGANRRVVTAITQNNGAQTSTPDTGWTEDSELTHAVSGGGLVLFDSIEETSATTRAALNRTIGASRRWISHSFALLPT